MTQQDAREQTQMLVWSIESFCDKYGIASSTFGRLAVNDGKFVSRIKKGSWIEPSTAERVHAFMQKANAGEIVLRGRPRRKKSESNAYTMSELVNQESSIRTPGSFALHEQRHRYHVFAATTNQNWVQGDIMTDDVLALTPGPNGLRIFYSPMDNGVTLTRVLRAVNARDPDMPVQVVMKGWGLEELRNTLGRMADRLSEHPKTVLIVTNLYTREAVTLSKTAREGPSELVWHDCAMTGTTSYDFQQQTAELFPKLASEWTVQRGEDDFPVYGRPSVVVVYREDHRQAIDHLIPRQGDVELEFDYAFLTHPFLHSHTMKFRVDYILKPVIGHLAPGGQLKVVQSFGQDPAHEIIQRVWHETKIRNVSRHDIISALKKSLGPGLKGYSFQGLTDARSLFRFDMHTLPVISETDSLSLSLQSAWNNAVYFTQIDENLAQRVMRTGTEYLDATRDTLAAHGGLWFVNESFSVFRTPKDTG